MLLLFFVSPALFLLLSILWSFPWVLRTIIILSCFYWLFRIVIGVGDFVDAASVSAGFVSVRRVTCPGLCHLGDVMMYFPHETRQSESTIPVQLVLMKWKELFQGQGPSVLAASLMKVIQPGVASCHLQVFAFTCLSTGPSWRTSSWVRSRASRHVTWSSDWRIIFFLKNLKRPSMRWWRAFVDPSSFVDNPRVLHWTPQVQNWLTRTFVKFGLIYTFQHYSTIICAHYENTIY